MEEKFLLIKLDDKERPTVQRQTKASSRGLGNAYRFGVLGPLIRGSGCRGCSRMETKNPYPYRDLPKPRPLRPKSYDWTRIGRK